MPEQCLFARCDCGNITQGILGWEIQNYECHMDDQTLLCILVQEHHDAHPLMAHNHHGLYNTRSEAEAKTNQQGFLVVTGQGRPLGEIKRHMKMKTVKR